MARKLFPLILISLGLVLGDATNIEAQESPDFHVVVNMVQLNVAVTDKKKRRPSRRAMNRPAVSENY